MRSHCCAELGGIDLVGHPAVGVTRHPPEAPLHHRVLRARAALPGEPGGIAGDPDRMRLLDGRRLDGHALKLIVAPLMRGLLLAEEPAQDRDAFLEPPHALGGADAHHLVLEGLRGTLLVRSAQAHHQPGAPAREHVQARPLLGEEDGMSMNKSGQTSHAQPHARRDGGERGHERHRLEAGLGEEAISDPDRVEGPRGLRLHRQLQEIAALDGSQDHGAVGKSQSERGPGHGVLLERP